MSDTAQKIVELVEEDRRYRFEAYAFVFETLAHAHKVLGLSAAKSSETSKGKKSKPKRAREEPRGQEPSSENHLTGQQLCEALRLYALEQYGYMAKCVFNNWGVRSTGDFGEIVYNLIRIGEMHKTKDDRREDFDDVYDFDTALRQDFRIERSK
ncbi:MAG TPA: Minf_1886 family protein [Pirellulales bacterium]